VKLVTVTLRGCSVRGCQRPHIAHGLCRMHYLRKYQPAWRARRREKKNAAGERTSPAAQEVRAVAAARTRR